MAIFDVAYYNIIVPHIYTLTFHIKKYYYLLKKFDINKIFIYLNIFYNYYTIILIPHKNVNATLYLILLNNFKN